MPRAIKSRKGHRLEGKLLRISGEQRLDGLDGCSGKCRENEFLWLVEGDARKPREIEAAGIFDRPAKGRLGGKPRDGEWRARRRRLGHGGRHLGGIGRDKRGHFVRLNRSEESITLCGSIRYYVANSPKPIL